MAKHKPLNKMPISERAKQFAPFSALKGFEKAIADKEKIRVPKKELSSDRIEEINNTLKNITPGSILTVIYYSNKDENYIQLTGALSKTDEKKGILQIINTEIPFEDIYDIII